jgi:hypothetical protein
MWHLFRPFSPLDEVTLGVRDLVAAGVLVQRELIDHRAFSSAAKARGLKSLDREQLERWDEQGMVSPLCFVRGRWTNWHLSSPYPLNRIEFRDEVSFRPWAEYEFRPDDEREAEITALYSEWQLLYVGAAEDATHTAVPAEVLLDGGERLVKWAESLRWFFEANAEAGSALHGTWSATIRLLLRLQARYWPFVHGRGVLLRDPETLEQVDPVDLEYDTWTAEDIATQLSVDREQLEALYDYLGWRGRALDPAFRVYDLLRLEPRHLREAQKGHGRLALDYFDAAEMVRRFHRELTGELLPDVDQDPPAFGEAPEPREFARDPKELQASLRRHGLYPHKLHIVAEGETEVRVVVRLFEAFAARDWDGSGLEITDLGGDRLDTSRPMLAGFGVYADTVALLLDNENDVERVTKQIRASGLVPGLEVKLCKPNLEEENFTAGELIALTAGIARSRGVELRLTEDQLKAAMDKRNAGGGRRKGMASVLVSLARSPEHGPVRIDKPELGEAMAATILEEIEHAEGRHEEVAVNRPIVRWVLDVPVRSYRT